MLVTVIAALGVSGAMLDGVVAPVWTATRTRQPALRLESSLAAAGQGVTLALLGGFRALVADGSWIRMWALWERRDLPGVETLIRLVTAIDPRPVYFWINGARIVAYDLPVWRVEQGGGFAEMPAAEQERISREQAQVALRQLDAAMAYHPASAELWVERANIQLNRLHDVLGAAASYRRAWEQPGAPYYAARMHAELLRRGGRPREALDWLRQLYPKLPKTEEAARADVVLQRIRDLERELRVPPELAFRPAQ